jgi:DNA (cytosine-5)-methyltransferase 1
MTTKRKKIRVFEAFAGYGGASFGLKKTKLPYEIIGFSEFDKYASAIFELNHSGIKNYGDITQIQPSDIPDYDMFTGGFPCQPFSTAGLGLGEMDIRGTLFYDVIRINEVKRPKHILLENVKGLTTRRHKATFDKIISELERLGYSVRWKVLNSKDYGIPQNRERLWIYGYRGVLPNGFVLEPEKIQLKVFFKDFLDITPDESLYLNQEQIKRLIEKHNVDLNVKEPLCLDIYNKKVRHDGISITITEPHHNSLRVIEKPKNGKFVVRKLSKTEHFRLMGFDENEFNFGDFSYQQICKRAGNGWDVNLVSKLLFNIFNQVK